MRGQNAYRKWFVIGFTLNFWMVPINSGRADEPLNAAYQKMQEIYLPMDAELRTMDQALTELQDPNLEKQLAAIERLAPWVPKNRVVKQTILGLIKDIPSKGFFESRAQYDARVSSRLKAALKAVVPLYILDPEVQEAIQQTLNHPEWGYIRNIGVNSLAPFVCKGDGMVAAFAKERMVERLKDTHWSVRVEAVNALACAAKEERVKEALLPMLEDRQRKSFSAWVREAAVHALIDYCSEPGMAEKMEKAVDHMWNGGGRYPNSPCDPEQIHHYRR